jgi:hypothetical protein
LVLRIVFVAALVALMAGAGCNGGSRTFIADEHVYITSPAPLSTVTTPFTVTWQAPKRQGQRYAVFVDQSPLSPGANLRDLAGESCRQVSSCEPNPSYLNNIGVYLTNADHVGIATLPSVGGIDSHQKNPIHTLTLVLMNASGDRVGTQAWQVQFRA